MNHSLPAFHFEAHTRAADHDVLVSPVAEGVSRSCNGSKQAHRVDDRLAWRIMGTSM